MLLESILKKIFGDPNAKELKNIQVIVDKINALEPEMQALSSANLAAKTGEFKLRLAKGETLDDILPEAFAVVRETSRRITGMRHFDVQLIGGRCSAPRQDCRNAYRRRQNPCCNPACLFECPYRQRRTCCYR